MMRFFFGLSAATLVLAGSPAAIPQPTGGGTAATITLSVTGVCPGVVTIDISGATPFGRIGIAYSPSTGSFTIPSGPCTGTVLGLDAPSTLLTLTTDASGAASVSGTVSSAFCGFFLQAVDLLPCVPSTVEVVP